MVDGALRSPYAEAECGGCPVRPAEAGAVPITARSSLCFYCLADNPGYRLSWSSAISTRVQSRQHRSDQVPDHGLMEVSECRLMVRRSSQCPRSRSWRECSVRSSPCGGADTTVPSL